MYAERWFPKNFSVALVLDSHRYLLKIAVIFEEVFGSRNTQRQTLTLRETNIAPENGWLEDYLVSYWDGLCSGAMLVSGRVTLRDLC